MHRLQDGVLESAVLTALTECTPGICPSTKFLPVLLDWKRCYLRSSRSLWVTGHTFQIGDMAKLAARMNSYSL